MSRQGGALSSMLAVCLLVAGTAQAQSLPTGWATRDIGSPAIAGSASMSAGTFTVNGAGADIWGTADQFRFVYEQVTGDIDISTRVASLEYVDVWTKAGVMIRESLAAGSRHAMMVVSPGKGLAFQRRTTTGGLSTHTAGGTGTAPAWVRLVRRGNVFTAFVSSTGSSWTTVASETITMASTVYVGLAVTSHDTPAAATATFDSVAASAAAASTSLPAPWQNGDIGNPAVHGSASASNGTFTVKGAGADIWDAADQFHYMYQPVTGDVELTARMAALDGVNAWTKGGVMIRESLTASSKHIMFIASRNKGWAVQWRQSTGGVSYSSPISSTTAPGWVRIVREGTLFTSYFSSDGVKWTEVDSASITMGTTVYVGLAVTSHDATRLATGTFSNVTVRPLTSNTTPSVSLTAPATGSSYTAPATVSMAASASDADGSISRVDFYAGTTLVGTDTSSPYAASWGNAAAGTYSLTAVATDNAGAATRSAAVSVTVGSGGNQVPTVSITSPASGASFTAPANITIAANAADADGSIARVDFYRGTTLIASDTTSPYSVTWSSVPAGSYALTAVARDNASAATTSAPVNITVSSSTNQPPTVSITSPTSGATFTAPANITIAANAADSDGTISRVDFYRGATLIGTDSASPYSISWTNVAAGSYSLTAVALDNGGATRTSSAVSITVASTTTTTLVFTASANHDTAVTSYSVALRRGTDPVTATPVATKNLGKPTPASNGDITADIGDIVNPLGAGTYYAIVTATGSAGSATSTASSTFTK